MIDHRFHELLAVRWIRLKTAADRPEIEERPPRAKIRIGIGEGRAMLPEVTVERRRETLEANSERSLKALEYCDRQCHLRRLALRAAQVGLITLQHTPYSRQEHLEFAIVKAVVPIQMFQLRQVCVVYAHRIAVKS